MGEQEEDGGDEHEADWDADQEASGARRWEIGRGFGADGHHQHHRGYGDPGAPSDGGKWFIFRTWFNNKIASHLVAWVLLQTTFALDKKAL